MNKTQNVKHLSLSLLTILTLTSCASTTSPEKSNTMLVTKSFLNEKAVTTNVTNAELVNDNTFTSASEENKQKFRFITPLKLKNNDTKSADDILSQFHSNETLKITADKLPLSDYLHYVLGEQLKVSYILADDVNADSQPVTLNLQDNISQRKLFDLTEELLTQREYIIRFDEGIFYIHKAGAKSGKGDIMFGYGKSLASVPQTSLEIFQMVPFEYGMQISLANTLRQLIGITANPNQSTNSISLQGKRKEIVKALELINILDQPSFKNRHIGIFSSRFLSTSDIIAKVVELLGQEGITAGKSAKLALSMIELDKQGEIIFFANNTAIIERAVFWAKQIDKPLISVEKQYFIYQPSYSRALDMGESLEALIGGGQSASIGNNTSAEGQNNASTRRQVTSASSSTMKMVVDERANALIFFTTGNEYQQMLPLIKRLDVLPKQIMLEVTIAEVKLTDKFASGVAFTLTNQGSAVKTGGFNLTNSAKGGLSYVLSGADGELKLSLSETNSNINVLSRPSLLVRDGVAATITVGDDIPTVGETIVDNGVSSSSVVYRKTGVDLTVKPTVNARGVVIMEIKQKISSQAEADQSVAGSPVIFERSIGTEVIAESGQTIVLGGLMSENSSVSDTSVPFFSSIPLIGKLFDTNSDSKDKTELVVLVTPRVIESSDEWDDIKAKFLTAYDSLKIE